MFNLSVKAAKEIRYKGLFTKNTASSTIGTVKALAIQRDGKTIYTLRVKFADYTSVDNSGDLMVKGCFKKSIDASEASNRKIAFCWQHDRKDPIGRITKFDEQDDGMYVDVELSDFDAVPNAKRAWYQVQDTVINQASFGYTYVWDAIKYIEPADDTNDPNGENDGDGYFLVGEVVLWEVSLVTLGDNENTEVADSQETQKSLLDTLLQNRNVQKVLLGLDDEEVKELLKERGIKAEPKRGLFARTT
jgi:HK97 family phage prohead protease